MELFAAVGLEGVVKVVKQKVKNQSGVFFETAKVKEFLEDKNE